MQSIQAGPQYHLMRKLVEGFNVLLQEFTCVISVSFKYFPPFYPSLINYSLEQMKYVGANIVYPIYKYDERLQIHREDIPPPQEVYMAVGYDPKHDSKQKHYRRFYEDELENIKELMPRSPFETYEIVKGQSRGLSKSWFFEDIIDDAGQVTSIKNVGYFKGIINVINKEKQEASEIIEQTRIKILKESLSTLSKYILDKPFEFDYETLSTAEGKEVFKAKLTQLGCEDLQIEDHFSKMGYKNELERLLMLKTECLVRVYILEVNDLPAKDIGGGCDPYLILKLDDTIINERDNNVSNVHNLDVYKMYEFTSTFPGCGYLRIQAWDYDKIFGDDFIGETVVDLEDRFFSSEWQSLK